jgi:hypothetical protein
MTIQDKIAALPRLLAEDEYFGVGGILLDEEACLQIEALQARLDLALEVLRFTQCLCSAHVTCDRCAVLAACGGEKP